MRCLAGVIALTSCLAAGQALPSFEVASVKQSAPGEQGRFMMRMGSDPGMVNYSGVTLKMLLARAYGVKDYQVVGPDWLNSERYDVNAKVPAGTPSEQVPLMLQGLLAERFKMS